MNNLNCEVVGFSHIGGRESNEDVFSILADGKLIVVADGMGGHAGGDQASAQAVSTVSRLLDNFDLNALSKVEPAMQAQMIKTLLLSMIKEANADIHALNNGAKGRDRMGTTLTLVYVGAHRLHIAWVGDSRVYIAGSGELVQLTDDHTLNYELFKCGQLTKAELRADTSGRGSHIITRSLGVDKAEPDYLESPVSEGDVVLCCSDGLNNSVSSAVLKKHLSAPVNVQNICAALIEEALSAGASDNVTAVVTRIPAQKPQRLWLRKLRSWFGL